jgi:hypothetical protein
LSGFSVTESGQIAAFSAAFSCQNTQKGRIDVTQVEVSGPKQNAKLDFQRSV